MAESSDKNGKSEIETLKGGETTDLKENNNDDNGTEVANDVEGEVKKYPYPKSIFFIVVNEFCERFMYYGMRTVLVLFLTRKLFYDDDTASIIYHLFSTFVYFFSVVGAILSDSFLGKFRTILYLSILYAIGSLLMSITAMPPLNMPGRELTIFSLFLVALGSGGIKPCVAAFGGDQFKLPEQAKQMITFFSIFYFTVNSGSFISTSITPILRSDVKCFEEDDCYSLAFGVPGALMVVSIVIFVCGKSLYKMNKPSGNMVVKVSKCIGNAISTKIKEKKTNPRAHWLDYAETKYGQQLVNETKVLLNVLVLYIPLPVFWALFDQQGSRWTFQATRMSGWMGSYEIKPDQMQVLNPALILIFIPLYDVLFYPLLSKIGIRRPLQKLALGGILAGVAFLCSAFVELELEKTYPVLPRSGESQLRLFNGMPCDYTVEAALPGDSARFVLNAMSSFEDKYIDVTERTIYSYTMTAINPGTQDCPSFSGNFNLTSGSARSYFLNSRGEVYEYDDEPNKSRTGDPTLRILLSSPAARRIIVTDNQHPNRLVRFDNSSDLFELIQLVSSSYDITVGGHLLDEYSISQGAVNTLIIREISSTNFVTSEVVIAQANSMHMLWLVPQYVIMTLGEVMYSITGLSFSYSQAPVSMKSVLQSCWLLTVAFGNVIDIIIIGAKAFDSQAHEFFLFAGIMFVDMVIFMILAYRYKSIATSSEQEELLKSQSAKPIEGITSTAETKPEGLDNAVFKKD